MAREVDEQLPNPTDTFVWEPDVDLVDEDWLSGVTCNPDAPEECESCS